MNRVATYLFALTIAAPVLADPLPPPRVVSDSPVPKNGLLGTWVREFEGSQLILKFGERRATAELRIAGTGPGKTASRLCRFKADYALSPDGVLFGYVTGSDVAMPRHALLATGLAAVIRTVEDEPFRFRYRMDDHRLHIRDLRVKGIEKLDDPMLTVLLNGEFRFAGDGPVAPPQAGTGLLSNRYDSDPNYRMNQLLNESEDLRQAREEMHRFWMNNQPAVLTYEKLNGAIVPGNDSPAPKPVGKPVPAKAREKR